MTTPLTVRPVTADEYTAYGSTLALAFGGDYDPEEQARELKLIPLDDTLAAFEGHRLVGTEGAFRMSVAIPGGVVPMMGVTSVAVLPTHRRRGVLTALMRTRLADMRARGEWLAGLWASESVIYRRFGYGVATERVNLEVSKRRAAFALQAAGAAEGVRLLNSDEARGVIPAIFARATEGWPGTVARTPAWWEHEWHDPKEHRGGRSALLFAVHSTDGVDDAYAVYRTKFDWLASDPSEVIVDDLASTSDAGYAAIWRYLLDIDLMEVLVARRRPVDEPLAWMLADRGAMKAPVHEGLWLRLVDVPVALAARAYPVAGSLALEVEDSFCPWNAGRYLLTTGPDGASCEPTSKAADIGLGVSEIAAAYLGGVRLSTLARAGRVREESGGALMAADAMFGWYRTPWCDRVF